MLGWIHERFVYPRRVRILAARIAELLPPGARVVDVGCGDGRIGRAILTRRPDIAIVGLEVRARPDTAIPVVRFDGTRVPCRTHAFDVALLVDVAHHARDPLALLAEASRVARWGLVIKDHLLQGLLAGPTLRLMDRVGNARHAVDLPFNYWSLPRWEAAFAQLRLRPERWDSRLGLYPFPASLLFDRSLHFVTRARPET